LKSTRRAIATVLLPLLGSCAGPRVADVFDEQNPPPHLGRPVWVRVPARIGAYAGAIAGGLVSIVLLPVSYPLSLLADESLGESRSDLLLFPAYLGAGAGHFVLGAPLDLVHYVGYRAWVDEPPQPGYDHVPLPPVVPPDQRPYEPATRPAESRPGR
jgi:hypothetical protein